MVSSQSSPQPHISTDASQIVALSPFKLVQITVFHYLTSCSTFSPEGRLFQVEYSLEAIKLGSTAIGVYFLLPLSVPKLNLNVGSYRLRRHPRRRKTRHIHPPRNILGRENRRNR